MGAGQMLDIIGTGKKLSQNALEQIARLKTGVLIRGAVRCGAIIAGADEAKLAVLTRYGELVGLAFQAADDLLDATAPADQLGKTPGKDKAQGKVTFVDVLGPDGTRTYAAHLADTAAGLLTAFGDQADPLRAAAEFTACRES